MASTSPTATAGDPRSFRTESSAVSQALSMYTFLKTHDERRFVWDDTNRELSDRWTQPVLEAGLDPARHKCFRHANKDYLAPPAPFIRHGADLGESGSTVVYRVRPPESSGYTRTLALKVIVCKEERRPPGPESRARRLALAEVRNMAQIRHPHIVAYVASFEDHCVQAEQSRRRVLGQVRYERREHVRKHILCIAMYPAGLNNLHGFMSDLVEYPAEDAWKIKYMYTYFGCLVQAVTYLHKSTVQIRHKDIKPENVIIDDFGKPLLTDFGLAKHFESGQQHSEGPTLKTVKYADPEATTEAQRDVRSDVFSLGSVYLELATALLGKSPLWAEEQLRDPVQAEFRYADTPGPRLDAYIQQLGHLAAELAAHEPERAASLQALVEALPHIATMMELEPTRRPYARDLFPRFRPLYDVFDDPGLCEHCEHQSLYGSGSSSPTTIKTNRSSTFGSTASVENKVVRRSSTLNSVSKRGSMMARTQSEHAVVPSK